MRPAAYARYADEFACWHPEFVDAFEHVPVPDEMFFHTVDMNSPFRNRLADDDLRYVDG